jgi:hypothetical protein
MARATLEAAPVAALMIVPLFFNPRTDRVFEPDKLSWVIALGIVCILALIVLVAESPTRMRLPRQLRGALPLATQRAAPRPSPWHHVQPCADDQHLGHVPPRPWLVEHVGDHRPRCLRGRCRKPIRPSRTPSTGIAPPGHSCLGLCPASTSAHRHDPLESVWRRCRCARLCLIG